MDSTCTSTITQVHNNDDFIDTLISKLLQCMTHNQNTFNAELTEKECRYVCDKVYSIFQEEASIIEISAPLFICGDIHGQYYDLLRIFQCGEFPPQARYLFLGDYVDRGKQSLETILLLFCYKIKYPNDVYLLRGNHESSSVNRIYGFYDECKRRLSLKIWKVFSDVFNILPIAALIDKKVLCMHGGLAFDLQSISQISSIQRPTEIPDQGILCDLLWSDPSDEIPTDWGPNERGISLTFSKDVVNKFVECNNIDLICRGHQVVEEGYEFFAERKLVTIFSAPNYTGEFDNYGAMLYVNKDLLCSFHIIKPISHKPRKSDKKKMKFFD